MISGRLRPETSFFESDIWQVKVRSDCVIISAENILRVFACNELHDFRTPPPQKVSFFSAPLHVVDSELQRVPVKTDACIVAVVADTHGFCNFLL